MTTDEDERHIRELVQDMHRFWNEPPIKGQPSRAVQLDEFLTAYRTGKNLGRALLWFLGLVIALGAAFGQFREFFK